MTTTIALYKATGNRRANGKGSSEEMEKERQ
jgi:hypothetical protein